MALHYAPRDQSSRRGGVGIIAAGLLVLFVLLAGIAWISDRFRAPGDSAQTQVSGQAVGFFDYGISVEAGHIRVNGTANFPNGIILVGTLDKVGVGPIEVKEALVMNRLFALAFGPELAKPSALHGVQEPLQAGVYRVSIEFDPAQQSPFAQESLRRAPFDRALTTSGSSTREIDPAIIRISEMFTIGSVEEQQEAQARDQQHQRAIRQHLQGTLETLTSLWRRLLAHYQLERSKGSFARDDLRTHEWQTWSTQWLHEVTDLGEKARLVELVSAASPFRPARDVLVTLHQQLLAMPDLYLTVLVHERPLTDRDLQRAEQVIQHALWDASAQLGPTENPPLPVHVEPGKSTVTVISPHANVRAGPGMSHEAVRQVKKDDVLDFLGEQAEWFQVQLSGGRTGWVHRNVVSKRPQSDGVLGDPKRLESVPFANERGHLPQLEPIGLLSTPVAYIPRPTADEVRIYTELELQLQDVRGLNATERAAAEQRLLQRMSEAYGISPQLLWNSYLKVQGWEMKP